MSNTPDHSIASATATNAVSARRLTRSITATWWYTASAVMVFELVFVFVAVIALLDAGFGIAAVTAVSLGGLVWWFATLFLLLDYRHRTETAPLFGSTRALTPLVISFAYGVAIGILTGIWIIALLPVAQALMLLNWPAGVRLRVLLVAMLALGALAVIDHRLTFADSAAGASRWELVVFYSLFLPLMTVLSLWSWDVLTALDRARAADAKLAATQERLRVATDVHDLQGHHLQVIALQLELAERLMATDADAALEQLRAARTSVDEARQGTRDLATRFRSVPLRDELANAVDLLRAAGTKAEASIDPDADSAPASELGPIIRETTTNVLRHGAGKWAQLVLAREGASWRYEISNDASVSEESETGSGLDGIARRAAEAGGAVEVRRGEQEFAVIVTIPATHGGGR